MKNKNHLSDHKKTKAQLIAELEELRRQVETKAPPEAPPKAGGEAGKGKPRTAAELAAEAGLQRLTHKLISSSLPDRKFSGAKTDNNIPHILIVDDDADLLATMSDVLKLKGFEPFSAQTGSAAQAQLAERDFAVALIDLRLSDVSGLDVLSAVKARSPETECILLTGHATQDSAIKAMQLNAFGFFQKPVDMEQVLLSIRRAVEKRKAGKALRESEERHRTILQTAISGFWLVDMQGRLLEVNETYCRMSGYSVEELLSMRIPDLEAAETADDTAAHIQKVAALGEDLFESRHRRKNGSVFDVEISVQYRPIEGGQFVVFLHDITKRKQAEEQLLDSQRHLEAQNMELRKLSLAIEQSGSTIVITDTNGIIQYANPRFEETTGYTIQEALGQNPRILKSGEQDQEFYRNLWGTITHGKVWRGELHNRRKDGSLYWEEATIAPVMDDSGKVTNFIAIKEEITERKRTEALLLESEARFREIIENAPDIIYRADINGNLTYLNPSALHILGYKDEAEILGRNYLEIAAPDWRKNLQRFYERQVIQRMPNSYSEFIAQTTSGQVVWLGQNTQLIMDGDQPTGIQAVARDITQLKNAYEALDIARNQALEASQLKSQLLARVSHELRTPLSGVLGYAELLMYDTFGELNPEQKDAAGQIIASANYLTNMVEDLLDEAQMTSKSLVLAMNMFAPAEVLVKAETTLQVLAANKGLQLVTSVAPDMPPMLTGDLKRLQQIIINLAGNAIKFTTRGEVRISLLLPKPTHWAIQIADTGAGIPKEAQGYIFEPFRQVNNSITRENRGSGLGLAISKQLVELMGGRITLESEVGQGSCFTITLPIQKITEKKND